jgi:isopenicillin N synthase-like dioxygenase
MVEIPTINVAPFAFGERGRVSGEDGRRRVVHEVSDAAAEFGFFHVVGHGVPDDLIENVWAQTRAFFALDRTAKLALLRTKSNSRGFYDRELTKNARDLKEVFDFAHVPFPDLPDDHPNNFARVDGFNRWPEDLAGFNATMVDYLHECERVSLELLTVFALGLDIEPAELLRHFERRHTSFIRMNYYPLLDPLEPDEAASVAELGDMALHHHSDAGAFTILLQDEVGGLQVAHRGEWIDVRPQPGAFVVNTGDMMQVWSNDRYRAALHRVVPTTLVERYSLPYFFNPRYDTDYAPLTVSEEDQPRYRPMNWGEFRQARADGDFADYGEEVQIAQYRI